MPVPRFEPNTGMLRGPRGRGAISKPEQ